MSLKKPTIVLFDMDGTTVRHLNPRILRVIEALDDWSFRLVQFLEKIFGRHFDVPALVERTENGERPKLLVHRVLHKFRRTPVDQIVEPCPGIYSLLSLLRARGVRLALVSNGLGEGYGHEILEKFNLAPFFETTLFREQTLRPKPNPDPILSVLKRLSGPVTADDVIWHIGDRRKDILAALAAQSWLPCPIQPIAYGLNAAVGALAKKLGPDHIVLAYADLEKRLRALSAA
ncbi:MAG: HAD hydrolase-like protein [Rhodospirillales bacterium]|nr:HAD hydrolase-like protein [Rhodospirillales bacterium]